MALFTKFQKLLKIARILQQQVLTSVFFSPPFCEVGALAIIHKRIQPNLAICQRGKQNSLGIVIYFGKMLGPIVLIWQVQKQIPHNVATMGYFCPKKKSHCICGTGFFLLLLECKNKTIGSSRQPKYKIKKNCTFISGLQPNLAIDHLFRYNTKLGGEKNPE